MTSPRKIITTHVHPPIPLRSMDWQAHFDGDEPNDNGQMPVGRGEAEYVAIIDLIENYEGEVAWQQKMAAEIMSKVWRHLPTNPMDILALVQTQLEVAFKLGESNGIQRLSDALKVVSA